MFLYSFSSLWKAFQTKLKVENVLWAMQAPRQKNKNKIYFRCWLVSRARKHKHERQSNSVSVLAWSYFKTSKAWSVFTKCILATLVIPRRWFSSVFFKWVIEVPFPDTKNTIELEAKLYFKPIQGEKNSGHMPLFSYWLNGCLEQATDLFWSLFH